MTICTVCPLPLSYKDVWVGRQGVTWQKDGHAPHIETSALILSSWQRSRVHDPPETVCKYIPFF